MIPARLDLTDQHIKKLKS